MFQDGGPDGKKRKYEAMKEKAAAAKKKKLQEEREDAEDDDEIDSDDEEVLGNGQAAEEAYSGDENDLETPQEKRLRIAKKYLEEIEKEEKSRAEYNADMGDSLQKRVTNDYLDRTGKLRRTVAHLYKGYNEAEVKVLKHKFHKLPITCLCLSSDGHTLFSGSKGNTVLRWDMSKTIADISSSGSITLTRTKAEETAGKVKIPKIQISCLALSTDSKFLAIGESSHLIHIYCPHTLTPLAKLKDHRGAITALVFRRDSHDLFSASKDRSVNVWSLDEMAKIETLYGHQSPITDIDALVRERAVTSGGSDASIRIWKVDEESQLVYNAHSGHNVDHVRLINEENFLSGGDDGSLCVWSALKKRPLATEPLAHGKAENGEANWITAVATYINTDLVASGSNDGFVRLWSVEGFRRLRQLVKIPVKGFVNGLQFNRDGTALIVALGQEHKNGRWWHDKEAKNCIQVIPLQQKAPKEKK